MTGRYPFRYGLQTIVIPTAAGYGLDTNEWLLPQCLEEAGYKTAIIGKWHLGHADMKYWPRQRGFDYQYGAMIGELDYFTHERAGVLDWFRNNKPVREKGYTTQLLGNDAVKYINEQTADKPFYLYLTFNAPHTPYQAPKEYMDRYPDIADPTRRTYAGMVACLDDDIGRVVAALDKKGLRDNTLIHFPTATTAARERDVRRPDGRPVQDQPALRQRPVSRRQRRALRGRLPCLRLRQLARPHQARDTWTALIHAVDIYPTFAALAGASTAKCKPLDGMNVWDTIAEGKPSPRTEFIYNVEPFRGAVRQGDWKLIWRTLIPTSVDLYNLADDPYETNNLAAAHPDKVAAMQQRLERRWPRNPPSRWPFSISCRPS